MKAVTIVCAGKSREEFKLEEHLDSDIWVWALCIRDYELRKRDAVFELHNDIWDTEEHAWNKYNKSDRIRLAREYLKWLEETEGTVYLAEEDETIQNSKAFPFDEVIDKFGFFFDNSASYMIAFAIMQGYKEIRIFGLDLDDPKEAYAHRSVLYYIGYAKALGIKLFLPDSCHLLIPQNPVPFEIYGIRKNFNDYQKDENTTRLAK